MLSALPQPAVWSAGRGEVAWLETCLPDLLLVRMGTPPKVGGWRPPQHGWVREAWILAPALSRVNCNSSHSDLRFRVGKIIKLSELSVLNWTSCREECADGCSETASQSGGQPSCSSAAHCPLCAYTM